jgi:hypothetical protein
MHARKPRPRQEPISLGAKLVWSDKDNKLVLQLPKGASPPPIPAPKPPSPTIEMIDRGAGRSCTENGHQLIGRPP